MNNGHRPASVSSSLLEARRLAAGYGQRAVVEDLSLELVAGSITALIGPNGSGKSTLLKALARLLRPQGGAVYLDGQALTRLSTREVARRLAVLPQGATAPLELTVGQLVEQGRYPHAGPIGMLREQDHHAIADALALTNTLPLRDRRLDSLSGGERQRAWIALALAQSTPILLLDEPTTYLDIAHQLEVLSLVQRLKTEQGKTVVLALHDLNQAARYADRLVALKAGSIVADGPPREVLTTALLAEVFAVEAPVLPHPIDGMPVCLPFSPLSSPQSDHLSSAEQFAAPLPELR